MVSSSTTTPAVDADFVAFIKEFLFNPSPRQDSSPPPRSPLRHQRTLPRHKRSRFLWRAAATSLMKKRYSFHETRLPPFANHLSEELPSQAPFDNGISPIEAHSHSPQTTHLPSAQQLHRGPPSDFFISSSDKHLSNFPLEISVDDGRISRATHSSADQFSRKSPSCISLDDGHSCHAIDSLTTDRFAGTDGLTTIDSLQYKHARVDINASKEAPLVTPACLNSTRKGSSLGCYSKVQQLEAPSTSIVPKRSSRKPPRPPRSTLSRSGSYRAVRLKNATRIAIVDNVRLKKQKSLKSSSNATPTWALIITLCFVIIMLVQGFLGSNYKELDSRAEGQLVSEGILLSSSYVGVPPLASERPTRDSVLKHEAVSSEDQLQQVKQGGLLFVNLRRRRWQERGATSWLGS